MEKITTWYELTLSSLESFGVSLMSTLPSILGAIIIILIGWLVAKMASKITEKILAVVKLDNRIIKLNNDEVVDEELLKKAVPSKVISKFVYWVIFLLFFIAASDILGWRAVSEEVSKLISFIPQLFIGLLIFIIGFYIASTVKNGIKSGLSVMGIEYGNLLASIVFYIILVVVTITAINQVGIDTTLISSNIVILFIALLATIAISFGIASKDFLINILSTHYAKNNLRVGQYIKTGDLEGKIETISKVQVVLKTKTGKVLIPTKTLVSDPVEIIEN